MPRTGSHSSQVTIQEEGREDRKYLQLKAMHHHTSLTIVKRATNALNTTQTLGCTYNKRTAALETLGDLGA
jgi:hypothetical protein